jgi:hypothetical protein
VRHDGLTCAGPVLSRYPDIAGLIEAGDEALSMSLRRAGGIGRPLGGALTSKGWSAARAGGSAPAGGGPKPRGGKSALSP